MNPKEKSIVAIQRVFPQATIGSVLKFSKGLASSVYKVEVRDPSKILAVKFFPKKIESRVEKSSRISSYVKENGLPSPQTYELLKGDNEGSVVMDCLPGEVASEVWETASVENQQIILVNSGKMLKKIHNLKIPPFWIHQKHEVTSPEEWVEWTRVRIDKYLIAAQENLDKDIVDFLRVKFTRLQDLYTAHPDFRFVPLHWDYHFSNINVDGRFDISGVFDFDNAMKGHDMADLGQTMYWLVTQQKISKIEVFEKFFTGYGELSSLDREFVYLHFLFFLAGVTRSTWSKEDLKWLNELHVEVLKKCVQGEYCIHTPAILK
jgi:aminoglycoside phosphotransferase (APT) family kinase protein